MKTKEALIAVTVALLMLIGSYVSLGLSGDISVVESTCVRLLLWAVVSVVAVVFILLCHKFALSTGYVGRSTKSENDLYTAKTKWKLQTILLFGTIGVTTVLLLSLCCGPSGTISPDKAILSLFSAIRKGGQNLTTLDEVCIYSSRFPRALAALAVGVGLSIAGLIYQAIIRNPLVDPYIMGVSSGAGTAAVAVIAFGFTFFGLFSSHSPYLIAATSVISGLIAFACTMMLAEKAGGSPVNYVLSGVIVGMAFNAAQTLMMVVSGRKIINAIAWLYGSFASISWVQLRFVFLPVLVMSVVPLLWAREFNLVLLGEDQARQMGLDVRCFNRCMLTYASVLTSICVAFVGIIGFLGLIVPHICRMFIGSDHRVVMPMSIFLGASLMVLADFISRMAYAGIELPVGAITTIVGIPVFIWILVKKGRMYDG